MHAITDSRLFLARAAAIGLGLFGFFGLTWTQTRLTLPLTRFQESLAAVAFGAPPVPVAVTLACSGTDTMALCLAAVLAYPAAWPSRLAGAAAGLLMILGLNTLRIGTLGMAAASPRWFDLLHLYAWPAVLTMAIAGFFFFWMRWAERDGATPIVARSPLWRFVAVATTFVLLFTWIASWSFDSDRVMAAGTLVARTSAWLLRAVGIDAQAAANVLWTSRGGFLVTQECVTTPLIPLYLAGICVYAPTKPRLVAGLLATVPLFAALAVARLLAAALPAVLTASPAFFIHAFNQILLAGVIVSAAAWRRHGPKAAPWRALIGAAAGFVFVYAIGPSYLLAVTPGIALSMTDPQGAVAFLPPFQVGLYLAVSIAAFTAIDWRRLAAGLAALTVTHTAVFLLLYLLTVKAGLTVPVTGVRAWAIAGPLMILAMVDSRGRATR